MTIKEIFKDVKRPEEFKEIKTYSSMEEFNQRLHDSLAMLTINLRDNYDSCNSPTEIINMSWFKLDKKDKAIIEEFFDLTALFHLLVMLTKLISISKINPFSGMLDMFRKGGEKDE